MSKDINTMGARSGKIIKSDNTVVNEGDGINPDGSRRVQLLGRNVTQTNLLVQTEIRDTAFHSTGTVDLSKYSEFVVFAVSSLDQDVELIFAANGASTAIWNGTKWDTDSSRKVTLSKELNGSIFHINSKLRWLDDPIRLLQVTAKCYIAPTTGNVTVYVWGVAN